MSIHNDAKTQLQHSQLILIMFQGLPSAQPRRTTGALSSSSSSVVVAVDVRNVDPAKEEEFLAVREETNRVIRSLPQVLVREAH